MADERPGPGGAGGHPASQVSAETIAADERQLVAFFHRDAGRTLGDLADRTLRVGRRVERLGLQACEEERQALRELTRVTILLLHIQFADLKGNP